MGKAAVVMGAKVFYTVIPTATAKVTNRLAALGNPVEADAFYYAPIPTGQIVVFLALKGCVVEGFEAVLSPDGFINFMKGAGIEASETTKVVGS